MLAMRQVWGMNVLQVKAGADWGCEMPSAGMDGSDMTVPLWFNFTICHIAKAISICGC